MSRYSTRKKIRAHIEYLIADIERAIKQHMNIEPFFPADQYPFQAEVLLRLGQGLAVLHDLALELKKII